jgi:hypothetical protein
VAARRQPFWALRQGTKIKLSDVSGSLPLMPSTTAIGISARSPGWCSRKCCESRECHRQRKDPPDDRGNGFANPAGLDLCSRDPHGADYRPRYWPLGDVRAVGRQPATSVVAPRSRPHDEAGDTSEIRSDHAGLAGGDRNRRPTRRPALRRRACVSNSKSSARNCPGSPDGTPFNGTAYSQAARRVRPKVMGFSKPR